MWASLFAAIKEALGLTKQQLDPEVIREAKLREIDSKLFSERTKRDGNMAIPRTPENENELAVELGIIDDTIIELRTSRSAFER